MEDSRIIELYFQRSEEAISCTADKYGPYCFSIAHSILSNREDARESVNDTYLACWNAIPPTVPNRFSAFIGRITRRISVNRYLAARAQKRGGGEPELALEELSQCIPSPRNMEQELDRKELARILDQFVRELPETQRQVFVLRYWYVKKVTEIAKQLGFSVSKVKSMLLRSRNKLRKCLEKEGISV